MTENHGHGTTTHTRMTEDVWSAFRADDRPGPIDMLNLIRLREQADYPDGRRATGFEAYAAYSRLSAEVAREHGMEIVWRGGFEMGLIGPERWDICFVARYPGVAMFTAMMRHPRYREAMAHRQAGVADSRLVRLGVMACGETFLAGEPYRTLPETRETSPTA